MNEKKTILLVEDEAPAALALQGALTHHGYDVLVAEDGEKGLALAKEKHPDLILTDLKMPKMGGMEMIAELRKDEWGKDVEVIILTNMSEVEMLEKAMENKAFFYIIKGDSSMADIVSKVELRLQKR
ncbi:MAG: putative transcriptional regulatory protein pdtaR [Nitrosomonadaceae bacterium]|nr:putative transcriptional regulatory protein pdtaR [Nitrosomonadaceae bacterium]